MSLTSYRAAPPRVKTGTAASGRRAFAPRGRVAYIGGRPPNLNPQKRAGKTVSARALGSPRRRAPRRRRERPARVEPGLADATEAPYGRAGFFRDLGQIPQ